MKADLTIFIWDQLDTQIRFFVLPGDYSHLNQCYINQGKNQATENELCDLVYDENGSYQVCLTEEFPVVTTKSDNVRVIVAGFLP